MKKGGTGGGHTARSGSSFEIVTDERLLSDLNLLGYVETKIVQLSGMNGPIHGRVMTLSSGANIEIFYKAGIYKLFFEPRNINYKDYFSARLEPDTAIYSEEKGTLTIVEKKQMTGAGSVAEKLQTCDYKQNYYETLVKNLNINIEIKWILGQYFQDNASQLKSVYEYMLQKKSKYYFHSLPVNELTL